MDAIRRAFSISSLGAALGAGIENSKTRGSLPL